MQMTKDWQEKWQKKRAKFYSPVNLNEYFYKNEIENIKIECFDIGTCTISSGEIIVRDPLCYLNEDEMPYFQKTPSGDFPVTVCAILPENDCARYAAVKVTLTENPAETFEEALIGTEDIDDFEEGCFFGFNVDAGLAAITDTKGRDAFCDFLQKWEKEHPDANIYDDYFAELFAQNYKEHPKYQRNGGDWINWTVPGTDIHIPFFQSGFGDGTYPVYMGYDKNGDICCIVVHFIDIKFEFADE